MTKFSRKGFLAIWATLMLTLVPVGVYVTMHYAGKMSKMALSSQKVSSKAEMHKIANLLLAESSDVDSDGRIELLIEGAGNETPITIPGSASDEWGNTYYYCTWDAGQLNTSDSNYSDNNIAPPISGLIGRLLSSGADGVIETACSDVTASGDDLILNINEADALSNTGGLSGWEDDSGIIRLITATDDVAIGLDSPNAKLHVFGDTTVEDDGSTTQLSIIAHSFSPQLEMYRAATSYAAPGATQSGTTMGLLAGSGYDGAAFGSASASIEFVADALHSAASSPTRIEFKTTPSGSTTQVTAATFTSDGDADFANGIVLGAYSGTPTDGAIQWNESTGTFQGYKSGAWVDLSESSEFSPADIAGLTVWLDGADLDTLWNVADTTHPTSGQTIAQWDDKSANGYKFASSGTAPTYQETGANGNSTVQSVNGGYMHQTIVVGHPYTLFYCGETLNTSASNKGFMGMNPPALMFKVFSTTLYYYTGATMSQFNGPVAAGQGLYTVATKSGGTGSYIRFNNGADNIIDDGLSNLSGDLRIGDDVVGNASLGDINEVIIYNRALTDAEITQVTDYLNTKWALW